MGTYTAGIFHYAEFLRRRERRTHQGGYFLQLEQDWRASTQGRCTPRAWGTSLECGGCTAFWETPKNWPGQKWKVVKCRRKCLWDEEREPWAWGQSVNLLEREGLASNTEQVMQDTYERGGHWLNLTSDSPSTQGSISESVLRLPCQSMCSTLSLGKNKH